ncbi:hypothetical protein ACFL96_12795 [Thermoproteota archaeon]
MKKTVLLIILLLCSSSVGAVMLDYDFGSYTTKKHPYIHGVVGDDGYDRWDDVMDRNVYHPCMKPEYHQHRFYAGDCIRDHPNYSPQMFSPSKVTYGPPAQYGNYMFVATDSRMVTNYYSGYTFYAGS